MTTQLQLINIIYYIREKVTVLFPKIQNRTNLVLYLLCACSKGSEREAGQ